MLSSWTRASATPDRRIAPFAEPLHKWVDEIRTRKRRHVAAARNLLYVHMGQDRRRIAVISRMGNTVFGSLTRRVERGSRRAHRSTGVVSSITASHSK